jgi:hypothetical protein
MRYRILRPNDVLRITDEVLNETTGKWWRTCFAGRTVRDCNNNPPVLKYRRPIPQKKTPLTRRKQSLTTGSTSTVQGCEKVGAIACPSCKKIISLLTQGTMQS